MVFNTGAALLDAIVPGAVSRDMEGTYGCKITQDVRKNEIPDVPAELFMAHISAIFDSEVRS
ncbi:hypothetical protein SAMN05216529_104290 [Faecalicatena contorta]|uniref:Uncharacterized protein n=1 Tax=Faecalicatena contorta TaxID=39482 RepID=A0A316A043_9FIRM|nr:hypothetical protein [Faecalicatena contorta]PWJ50568.1 hypothetical protein A8805_104290 [Faecalicatena contorta]SUQ13976.1 hypothetical protein SAMN05216529_104290 [Faecalicatena contorta]